MSLIISSSKSYLAQHQIHVEDDEQSLLSRDRSQTDTPLPPNGEPVKMCDQVKDTCQNHRLPAWAFKSAQSGGRKKSSSDCLGCRTGHDDPDMTLPFDTVLSTFSAWLNKIKTRSHKNSQQLLWKKYDYQEDILDDVSSHIRICLVRAKSIPPSSKEHNKLEQPGKYFAVKLFFRPQNLSLKMYLRRVTGEFCIAHTLQHPNIVRVVELLSTSHGDLCQVMEFCDAGSLLNILEKVTKLEPAEADCFLKQLLHGVQYMHSVGISHRNLKPENILLTREGVLKITDFCYAECFQMPWASSLSPPPGNENKNKNNSPESCLGINTRHQDLTGTVPFMAPEQFASTTFDPAAGDMWAVGIIYFAMRSGRLPWRRAAHDDPLYRSYLCDLESGRCNKYMELVSGDLRRRVLYSIVQPAPQRRLTATQALDSDWIREVKMCAAATEEE